MGKICGLVFVSMVAMVILGVSIGIPLAKKSKDSNIDVLQLDSGVDVAAACQTVTSYPATCIETLAGGAGNHTADSLIRLSLQSANRGVNRTWDQVLALKNVPHIDVCAETLGSSLKQIQAALSELSQSFNATSIRLRQEAMDNIKAWVSAAMELHTTCIDAVQLEGRDVLQQQATHTDQLFSNALAFINAMAEFGEDLTTWKNTAFSYLGNNLDFSNVHIPEVDGNRRRRLLRQTDEDSQIPSWMDAETQRHLLQTLTKNDSGVVVVAKDGSGQYETIQAAVDTHKVNDVRLVIYVKAGTYNEQVTVPDTCKFLTITGDGDATVITGDKNVGLTEEMHTFNTGTLLVSGEGFIGKWFLVQNTAGAEGHQAVAFRGTADRIALYRVTFDGYQDTLYAHAFRQYYRECNIRGTVDFIFGNAAASFQSCRLVAKKTSLQGQQNTYSAHGRTDPHQQTGLAFHNCIFDGSPELVQANSAMYPTYLGRPWGAYSVCVVLRSELKGHINPTGWMPWNATNFGLYTSYFAEYQNFGPGANTANRVDWSHQISAASVANKYIANNFVQAADWVSSYDIPLTTNL